MKPILLIYASLSGNTEMITDIIAEHLRYLGHEVDIKAFDFDELLPEQFHDYSAIVVGTYTWDGGQLPYEVEDFYIDLAEGTIKGQTVAVYGAADSCYDSFGQAIDMVADQAETYGAHVLDERLKVDISLSRDDERRCQ